MCAAVAVAGKGGVGKTALSALIIRALSKRGGVFAVDADPDSNLPHALGVTVEKTVAEVREEILNAPIRKTPADKSITLEIGLYESIQELPQFDMIVMGHSERDECYCAINSITRRVMDLMTDSYDFVVIDCHAGLEHLSRRTTRGVDIMNVVTEPTKSAIMTAKRVKQLSDELGIDFGEIIVVANKITSETKPLLDNIAKEQGIGIDFYVPYDQELLNLDILGNPTVNLSRDSPVSMAVDKICHKILET
jgi:CO dehydrogenase maturation factor